MNEMYGRDLDLNLLRVFVLVAETGSVTEAARRLYLTQPAISAALKRLSVAVRGALFAREGRRLVLTARGQRLFATARPHLEALVAAALAPERFDPKTNERTVRIGLSDVSESWLLAPLLRVLAREAPRMCIVVLPVQFRTVGDALATARIDLAITVADELPAGTERRTLFTGDFVCLFDPGHARLGRSPSLERYLAHEHVIVSYNGDLRGVVEDVANVQRTVRVSVPTFQSVGPVIDGSALVATVPRMVAKEIVALRPHLRTARSPVPLAGTPMELVWRSAIGDDEAIRFVMAHLARLAERRVRS